MTTVLFDTPGPRARRRNLVISVVWVGILLAFLGYVVYKFQAAGQFDGRVWSWLQYSRIQEDLIRALIATLQAFAVGAVLALAFGALFATGRLSIHRWVSSPSMVVVEFFRAIPLLILMFLFYYGLPTVGIKMTPFMAVVLGLTLYNGSVLAELFRAGIHSLPKGQAEAAYALGMRKTQVMVLVLLPQALRAMLPAIVSQLVVLLKDTALGFLITYEELLKYASNLGRSFQLGNPQIPAYLVVTVIYITMCLLLTWLASYLEKRNRRSRKVRTRKKDADPEPLAPAGATL